MKLEQLTTEQTHEILAFVPSWHVCVLGPVPFGETVCETDGEALQRVWDHVQALCEMWRTELDTDEWDLLHITPVNQS